MAAADETPRFREVYSDQDILVLDKPAGLVVHEAPSHKGETLVDQLEGSGQGGENQRPGIVHRLDKDTSGLMVVALSEEAFTSLGSQIRKRTVRREYLALVEGHLGSDTGTIEAPVGRSRRERTKMTVGGVASREATTHFDTEEVLPAATLVRARLETGRTHQIRVHFSAIGHPVVGDPRYGKEGTYGLGRQFLHAETLEFLHPRTGELSRFSSPLPSDLMNALEHARGEA